MLNRDHALCGLVTGLAAGVTLRAAGLDPTPADVAMLTALTAGAAILPDFDHPDSVPAHSLGWPTRLLARGVSAAFGGHRQGAHSWLGIATVTAAAGVAATDPVGASVAAMILLGLAGALVVSGRGLIRCAARFAAAWLLIVAAAPYLSGWWSVPLAAALGSWTHVLGDRFTGPGVPWWWPISKRRYGTEVFTTDRDGARWPTRVLRVVLTCALIGLLWAAGRFTEIPPFDHRNAMSETLTTR